MSNFLPPTATPLERGLVEQGERIDALPVPITDLENAATCPAHLLPWVAWGLSVDAWDRNWTDERKRQAVATAFDEHRLKGTAEGLRRAARLAGGQILRIETPPSQLYLGSALNTTDYRASLARLPQLQIFRRYRPAKGDSAHLGRFYIGRDYLASEDIAARTAPQAFVVDENGSQPVQIEERDGITQIALPGKRERVSFVGQSNRYLPPDDVSQRVYRFRIVRPGQQENLSLVHAIAPRRAPVAVEAKQVAIGGRGVHSLYLGVSHLIGYLPKDDPTQYGYDEVPLLPATSKPTRPRTHLVGRIRMPAFTAEVQLALYGTRRRSALRRYLVGFLPPDDLSGLKRARTALAAAQPASARVWLDTQTFSTVRVGTKTQVGGFRLGEQVRS